MEDGRNLSILASHTLSNDGEVEPELLLVEHNSANQNVLKRWRGQRCEDSLLCAHHYPCPQNHLVHGRWLKPEAPYTGNDRVVFVRIERRLEHPPFFPMHPRGAFRGGLSLPRHSTEGINR